MDRSLPLILIAVCGCQETRPVETAPVAAVPAVAVPTDAAIADASVDACAASAYPVPTDVELHDQVRDQHAWFHGADRELAIEAACDLADRVVMIQATKPATMWIYSRADGAVKSYRVDWQSPHAGRVSYNASEAPDGNHALEVIAEGPPLHLMNSIGDGTATTACRFAGGGAAIADPLIACSTRRGLAKIDALPARPCAGHTDGLGWPLQLTWWGGKGPRTADGTLDAISPDRATFTYRFGTGKDTVELTLHPGDHAGSIWFADGHREDCALIYTDHRRGT